MARWPVLPAALVALATERARRQAAFQAICHHVRIGARIVGLLWQLADRFGRVMPAAAVVPLGLTRETIAALIGAQRPSVTTALGSLRERHVVERRPDGAWVLRPETDAELARMFARTREIRTPEIEIIEEPPSPPPRGRYRGSVGKPANDRSAFADIGTTQNRARSEASNTTLTPLPATMPHQRARRI